MAHSPTNLLFRLASIAAGAGSRRGAEMRAKAAAKGSVFALIVLSLSTSALLLGSCHREPTRQEPAPYDFSVLLDSSASNGICGIQAGPGQHALVALASSASRSERIALLMQQAVGGSATAELLLSQVYLKGAGIPPDPARSKALLQDAAQKRQLLAEGLLGRNLVYGWDGFQKEPSKGLALLMTSALQGCSVSAAELGQIYSDGEAVQRDAAEGLIWYSLAASQNEPDGDVALGDHYYYGDDPKSDGDKTPDYETAIFWYRRAASSGSVAGEDALADLLSDDDFGGHNYQLAASTYESAAINGDAHAEYWLGDLLSRSEWAGHDLNRSYQFYLVAALNKDDTWRSKAITAIYSMMDSVSPLIKQRFPPPPEPLNNRLGRYGHYVGQVLGWGVFALFAIPITLAALSAVVHRLRRKAQRATT